MQMQGDDDNDAGDAAMDISPSRSPVDIKIQAWVSELAQASADLRTLGLKVCVQAVTCRDSWASPYFSLGCRPQACTSKHHSEPLLRHMHLDLF